jgi:hypothetical protein
MRDIRRREVSLEERENDLKERENDLKERENDLKEREKKLTVMGEMLGFARVCLLTGIPAERNLGGFESEFGRRIVGLGIPVEERHALFTQYVLFCHMTHEELAEKGRELAEKGRELADERKRVDQMKQALFDERRLLSGERRELRLREVATKQDGGGLVEGGAGSLRRVRDTVPEQWVRDMDAVFGAEVKGCVQQVIVEQHFLDARVPEIGSALPLNPLRGLPDFRRIHWKVANSHVDREHGCLSTAERIVNRAKERRPYDVSVLAGVSGCGKTRSMFDIARHACVMYFDFGQKDIVVGSGVTDMQSFLSACRSLDCIEAVHRLLVARLCSIVLALKYLGEAESIETKRSCVLRLQLNGLCVVSGSIFRQILRDDSGTVFLLPGLFSMVKQLMIDESVPDGNSLPVFCVVDEAVVLLEELRGKVSPDRPDRSLYHKFVQAVDRAGSFPLVVGGTMGSLFRLENIVSRVADHNPDRIQRYVEFPMFGAQQVEAFLRESIDFSKIPGGVSEKALRLVCHLLSGRPRFTTAFVERYIERRRSDGDSDFYELIEQFCASQRSFDDVTSIANLIDCRFYPHDAQRAAMVVVRSCLGWFSVLDTRGGAGLASEWSAGILPLRWMDGTARAYVAHEPLLVDALFEWFDKRAGGQDPLVHAYRELEHESGAVAGKKIEALYGMVFVHLRFRNVALGQVPLLGAIPGLSQSRCGVRVVRSVERHNAEHDEFRAPLNAPWPEGAQQPRTSSGGGPGSGGGASSCLTTSTGLLEQFPPGWCYVLPEAHFGPDGIFILPVRPFGQGSVKSVAVGSGSFGDAGNGEGFFVAFLGSKTTTTGAAASRQTVAANERTIDVSRIDRKTFAYVKEFKRYVRSLQLQLGPLRGFVCISALLFGGGPDEADAGQGRSGAVVEKECTWDGERVIQYTVSVTSGTVGACGLFSQPLSEKLLEWFRIDSLSGGSR